MRVNGNVATALSTTADDWTTGGLELTEGHAYKVTLEMIGGTCTYDGSSTPSVSIYPVGTNSTIGSYYREGTTKYIRVFTAGNTSYNICIYVSQTMVLSNAKCIVTLEDLTDPSGAQTKNDASFVEKYFDTKINLCHNFIDYGYGNKIDVLESTGDETSGAWIGVKRYKTSITFNMAQITNQKRVRITGDIARVSGNTAYKSWEGQLQLTEGVEYILTLKYVSGLSVLNNAHKLPSMVVYASGGSSSIASLLYSSEKEAVRKFTAPSSSINIAFYFEPGLSLTNAVFDVTLSENTTNNSVESYYLSELSDTVSKVRSVNNRPSLVFPFVTDIHRYTASVQTFSKMIQNIRAFCEAVKCDFIANGGDTIEGDAAKATSLGYAYDAVEDFKNIGVPLLYAQGNHDNNPYISSGAQKFNLNEVYSGFFSATRPDAYNTSENGTDYYVDFDALGVRIIALNACNVSVSNTYAYGASTAAWLTDALDTDKTVILLEHLSSISSQVWNNNRPTNHSGITSALTAFVQGGGNLIQLCGHSHVDMAFISPWLSIAQVCQKFAQADITSADYEDITGYIEIDNPARAEGTATEDAWSVCVYDPADNILHMIRFGAGVDRHFHVAPISPATVTSILTGTLTWSTSNSSVAMVASGVITGVATGRCAIMATDENGNHECWIVDVA